MKIPRKPMKADVPSTAMGDIAFNLLIFFVILAKPNDDSHLKWNPAQASNLQQVRQNKVNLVIDTKGGLFLNGRALGEVQLKSQIESLLGDSPAGSRTVMLKVDRLAPAQKFEPVIEAISEAGGELVHVLEEKR
jgi:biopolymer transport protein ExbD